MTKRAKSPSKTANELDSAAAVAEDALQAALRVVRGDILDAEAAKPGSKKRAQVPRLATQVVAISCELRKAGKAQDAAVRDLTSTSVVTWARLQTPEARARLVRDLTAIDSPNRRSVLG